MALPQDAQEPQPIPVQKIEEIRITFNPNTKEVNITGPIQDKLLCFGMLEMAKMIVTNYNPPKINPASGILVPRMSM